MFLPQTWFLNGFALVFPLVEAPWKNVPSKNLLIGVLFGDAILADG